MFIMVFKSNCRFFWTFLTNILKTPIQEMELKFEKNQIAETMINVTNQNKKKQLLKIYLKKKKSNKA